MIRGGLALWLILLAGFVVLSAFAAAFDRFAGDLWLAERLQDIDAEAFARSVDWAEDFVDAPLWIIVWLGGAVALFAAARRPEALMLLASAAGRAVNTMVKEIVGRPRPSDDLVAVSDASSSPAFPSGHADSALVLYGLLFYFVTVLVRRPLPRLLGQAACLWVIVFTGLERVYVGAHWPSDVLGGYYLGALMLAALIAADRRLAASNR